MTGEGRGSIQVSQVRGDKFFCVIEGDAFDIIDEVVYGYRRRTPPGYHIKRVTLPKTFGKSGNGSGYSNLDQVGEDSA